MNPYALAAAIGTGILAALITWPHIHRWLQSVAADCAEALDHDIDLWTDQDDHDLTQLLEGQA